MKTLFIIAAMLLSMVASAQTDLEKTTLDINKQIRFTKTCAMFGGVAFVGGGIVQLVSAGKEAPDPDKYTDAYKYQQAVTDFNKRQKSAKTQSGILYAIGGLMILTSGIGLTQIDLRSGKSLTMQTSPDGISLALNF